MKNVYYVLKEVFMLAVTYIYCSSMLSLV